MAYCCSHTITCLFARRIPIPEATLEAIESNYDSLKLVLTPGLCDGSAIAGLQQAVTAVDTSDNTTTQGRCGTVVGGAEGSGARGGKGTEGGGRGSGREERGGVILDCATTGSCLCQAVISVASRMTRDTEGPACRTGWRSGSSRQTNQST